MNCHINDFRRPWSGRRRRRGSASSSDNSKKLENADVNDSKPNVARENVKRKNGERPWRSSKSFSSSVLVRQASIGTKPEGAGGVVVEVISSLMRSSVLSSCSMFEVSENSFKMTQYFSTDFFSCQFIFLLVEPMNPVFTTI